MADFVGDSVGVMDWRQMRHRLRERREAAGLTQRELAETVLVTQPYISQLESGKSKGAPPLDLTYLLAQACHTSIDYLAGLTDDSMPRQTGSTVQSEGQWVVVRVPNPEQRNQGQRLLTGVTQLPDDERALFWKVMDLVLLGFKAEGSTVK